jgi:hypothetical protein
MIPDAEYFSIRSTGSDTRPSLRSHPFLRVSTLGTSAVHFEPVRYDWGMHTDTERLIATSSDNEFVLTIDDALERYARAGLPRTPRSVQRYCAKGHLQCRLVETSFGEKYLIAPGSVDKHIAYINEVTPPTSRDASRPVEASEPSTAPALIERQAPTIDAIANNSSRQVATGHGHEIPDLIERQPATEPQRDPNEPRQVPTETESEKRYVTRLESDIAFLRTQISVKDSQIKDLTERARETNHLIGGLQRMLSPLLGSREHQVAKSDADDHGLETDRA